MIKVNRDEILKIMTCEQKKKKKKKGRKSK